MRPPRQEQQDGPELQHAAIVLLDTLMLDHREPSDDLPTRYADRYDGHFAKDSLIAVTIVGCPTSAATSRRRTGSSPRAGATTVDWTPRWRCSRSWAR